MMTSQRKRSPSAVVDVFSPYLLMEANANVLGFILPPVRVGWSVAGVSLTLMTSPDKKQQDMSENTNRILCCGSILIYWGIFLLSNSS